MLIDLYSTLTAYSAPVLQRLLKKRLRQGKEHPQRWQEKTGRPGLPRPDKTLVWIHAASVGEAQSALTLIEKISQNYPHFAILITSGTKTSGEILGARLHDNALHQFAPLDHPAWVERFLDHWKPDLALWLESELWPNMLHGLKKRKIPAVLLNARLSPKSFKWWSRFPKTTQNLLSAFNLVLTQTEADKTNFQRLGSHKVICHGNIKYSAAPLPYDEAAYNILKSVIADRPVWLYASTHAGEEMIAARIHKKLKSHHPHLLTVIVPRHPDRGGDIVSSLQATGLKVTRRNDDRQPPEKNTDIYLADTLGELGLFYRLCPVAVIGRSFSDDGGGGHNPIEAAQLNCAVLHGPSVQNLQQIYDDMHQEDAAIQAGSEDDLRSKIDVLLSNPKALEEKQDLALAYAKGKDNILVNVWGELAPYMDRAVCK